MMTLRSSLRSCAGTLMLGAVVMSMSPAAHAQPKGSAKPPATAKPAATATPSATTTSKPAPSPERAAIKAAAADLFDRGVKAMEEERWEDCRASFLAALHIDGHYQIAGSLGVCEAKLARYADAAEHMTYALRTMPSTASSERRTQGEKLLAEVRPKVAEITIRTNKTGAEIFFDGRSLGRSPLAGPMFIEPGAHKIEAKLDGATARADVTATGGGTHEATVTFEEPKKVEVETGPRSEIWITGAAVAGLGLVTGGVLVGVAEAKKSEADTLRTDLLKIGGTQVCADPAPNAKCSQLQGALQTRYTLGNAGAWALIGGGAVAAATVAYVLVTRRKEPPPVQAAVFAGPSGGGAIVSGSF